jgi:hypothetical protein
MLCDRCNELIVQTSNLISVGYHEEDIEPLLQHDRSFGSLLYCYGYISVDSWTSLRLLTFKIVLHLWHKLAYFKSANWEPEWIESAEKIVHKEYKRSYASRAATSHEDKVEELPEEPLVSTIPLHPHVHELMFLHIIDTT